MKGFFVVLLTGLILGWLATQARTSKARLHGGCWIFDPIISLRVVFFLVVLMGLGLVFLGAGDPKNRVLGIAGGLGFIAFAMMSWPKAVQICALGLSQRSWLGQWKTIPWQGIQDVKEKRDGSVIVCGTEVKIVLSPYHADRDLFLSELRQHWRTPRQGPTSGHA